jgi:hypothetical protein
LQGNGEPIQSKQINKTTMKEFRKYQHLERFGTSEVQNIELGDCYVFPKDRDWETT